MTDAGSPDGTAASPPDGEPQHTRTATRRDALRWMAQTGATAGTLGAFSRRASADHWHEKPAHVTIQWDPEWCAYYRPMLDLSAVDPANYPTILGWRVSSPEHELDVGVYCNEYAVQRDAISLSSHAGDHEWIYVFVDRSTGEVDHVSYTAYHWLRGYTTTPTIYDGDGGRHPVFRVAQTYHHHIPLPSVSSNAVLRDVSSLGNYGELSGPLYQWLANGMEKSLDAGTVHNPWLMSASGPRSDWWTEQGRYSLNYWIAQAWLLAGMFGADSVDFGEANL